MSAVIPLSYFKRSRSQKLRLPERWLGDQDTPLARFRPGGTTAIWMSAQSRLVPPRWIPRSSRRGTSGRARSSRAIKRRLFPGMLHPRQSIGTTQAPTSASGVEVQSPSRWLTPVMRGHLILRQPSWVSSRTPQMRIVALRHNTPLMRSGLR